MRRVTLWMCDVCQTIKGVYRPEKLYGQIYCSGCRTHRTATEIVAEVGQGFWTVGK